MSPITTHVLDTARGRPAAGLAVVLERWTAGGQWTRMGHGVTDDDGRARDLLPGPAPLERGRYRLVFDTGAWFSKTAVTAFYPQVTIEFTVADSTAHHHVPLLLSPFGYSTYRGS